MTDENLLEKDISMALAKVFFGMKKIFTKLWSEYDITPEQVGILTILWDEDGLSQHDIARRSIKDAPSTARLISRLIDHGFVKCVTDREDRRCNNVFLTEKGRKLEKPAKSIMPEYNSMIYGGISNNRKEELLEILQRMYNNIENIEVEDEKNL